MRPEHERRRRIGRYLTEVLASTANLVKPGAVGVVSRHKNPENFSGKSLEMLEVLRMGHRPILCLDFDGVIHSYTSGWKGPRTIPNGPVIGALEFLLEAMDVFEVHIFSSRSNYVGGRWAMKRWLIHHFTQVAFAHAVAPRWLSSRVKDRSAPWEVAVRDAIRGWVMEIKFPRYKPPALVTIDDRAIQFVGEWPGIKELRAFKPWYKSGGAEGADSTNEG